MSVRPRYVLGSDEAEVERLDQQVATIAPANMAFERGDARTFRAVEPFDAIVTRLLLFHLPDAVLLPPCVAGAWAVRSWAVRS